MPATRELSLRRPCSIFMGRELREFTAFGIMGFANTIFPCAIFSGLYLIIPFPPPIVLLIELLPALAINLLLPHLLRYIFCSSWLIFPLASCWALAARLTSNTPPNIEPLGRILLAVLASASASAAQVLFLSRLPHHGKAGLAGWGAGTGAGAVVCAVMPAVLTLRMGVFLSSAVDYVRYLAVGMVIAYVIILPSPSRTARRFEKLGQQDNSDPGMETPCLLVGDSLTSDPGFFARIRLNIQLAGKLFQPCMMPLLLAFAAQLLISPGISRANGIYPSFERFFTYSAAYGLAFQLGNLASRSLALLFRTRKLNLILSLLGACSAITLFNTTFLFTSSPLVVLPLVFCIGVLGGAMYVNILALAIDYMRRNSDADAEFALGIIGAGETAGILLGSLIGVVFETQLCGLDYNSGRWCSTVG